ncbi:MAG: glyceraldehyde 3-phosphate dehydrogenase (NAD(P)+) [uncultured archaeon A07HR60]|nr:MAG: glyceraldehyde 3-phosphate dehydrogenase (NAD(P)+) [uncultured archaeon A07HR60]
MIRVGVNGYGTIGKRVADAVVSMPDMELVGVAKASANHTADAAADRGYNIYVPEDRHSQWADAGMTVAGDVHDLIELSDIVADTTPAGMGAEYRPIYEDHDTPALFQGGENADIVEASFTARANYSEATDKDYVRVVSCNTTGLNRMFAPLHEKYGVERASITLVRCRGEHAVLSADPVSIPSHHGPDALEVIPDMGPITTMGMKAPTVRHHFHGINVTLGAEPSAAEVRDLLASQSRIHVIDGDLGIDSGWELQEYALDRGRDRMNLYENQIFEDSITMDSSQLHLFQSIHRESDVVPENIDAIRAVAGEADAIESIEQTNDVMGIGDI